MMNPLDGVLAALRTNSKMRAPALRDDIRVEELSGEPAFHALKADWDALWKESEDATHFQLWDWQYLYWKHILPHADPRFLTVRDQQHRLRALAVTVRTRSSRDAMSATEFLGGTRSDFNMILAASGADETTGVVLLRRLVQNGIRRSGIVSLTNVPENSWTGKAIRALQRDSGCSTDLIELTGSETYTVPLPASLDEYVAGLGPRARRNFGYERRRLKRERTVDFRVYEGGAGLDQVLDTIEAIDLARWGTTSMYRGIATRALEQDVIKALAARGLLMVFLLYADGKPVSFAWCALVRGVVEVDRIAYNPSFPSKYSVGKVATFCAIEECIRRGHVEFDLARGGEVYKSWVGARPEKLLSLRVYRSAFDRSLRHGAAAVISAVRRQPWLRDAFRKLVRR